MENVLILFGRDEGKVKSFNTASGPKGTRLTIVLEFTDPYALSRVMQELHSAQHPPKPRPAPPPVHKATPRRATLPAPPLSLPYFGDEK